MSKAVLIADQNTTISELQFDPQKAIAAGDLPTGGDDDGGVVKDRIQQDDRHVLQPYTLMAHKPNYLLFAAYNSHGYNSSLVQEVDPEREWGNTEAQFQLSMKFPLLVNMWDDTFDIYAGYTNRSFWQIYDPDSAPFRETNHEPEILVQFHPDW